MDNTNDFATGMILGENRNGYGNGFGGDGLGFFWIFALLMLNNGGFWGNNRGGNPVTEADLCQSQSFAELKGAVGRGFDQQTSFAFQNQRDICEVAATLSAQIAAAAAAQERCCCETKSLIQQTQYENAKNAADINSVVVAQTQKILDAICGNRMADMQNRINQLELNNALCGIVRYPTQTTYGAGVNPFFNNGCNGCCGNGNI